MKILYFMNHVSQGGAALALYDLICELKKQNNDKINIVVITGELNELNRSLNRIGVENYFAPFKNFMSSSRSPKIFWRIILIIRYWINRYMAIRKLEKVIDFEKIDIIHSNLNRVDIGNYFSKKYKIPHVWHLREFGKGGFDLISVYKDSISHMLSNCTYTTFVSISNVVNENWSSLGIKDSRVINDGICPQMLKNISHKDNQKVSFIFVGGYTELKGQLVFLEGVSLLPVELRNKINIDFFGNGEKSYYNSLKAFIHKEHLENIVHLNDYNDQIYNLYANYDVGVNASRNEGFGRVTIEYMMAGLCPLVSNSGANPEIIDDNINGLLFVRDDKISLMKRLVWIIENRNKLNILANNARIKSLEMYTIQKHAQKVLCLYNEILNENLNCNTCL